MDQLPAAPTPRQPLFKAPGTVHRGCRQRITAEFVTLTQVSATFAKCANVHPAAYIALTASPVTLEASHLVTWATVSVTMIARH